MNEKDTGILEKYDVKLLKTSRTRGAILCETDKGPKLLKECTAPETHIARENAVLEVLSSCKSFGVDSFVRSRDGELVCQSEDGGRYILKNWFDLKECSAKDTSDILEAVKVLSELHFFCQKLEQNPSWTYLIKRLPSPDRISVFQKHTRELKRAKNYIRTNKKRGAFELCMLRSYDDCYDQALKAQSCSSTQKWELKKNLCHGDFSHHNILLGKNKHAIVNFSRMYYGYPIEDLYFFVRKIMEKHNWDKALANKMFDIYQEQCPLTCQDFRYLYLLFLYPEKYWKQINYYYNANKAWIPGRNIEKLINLEAQAEVRKAFLSELEERASYS